jgi:NAD(P)-dependent dehydrogenase (short-subunit alcohol dehydrogenase family)
MHTVDEIRGAGGVAEGAIVDLRDAVSVPAAVQRLLRALAPGPTDLVLAAGTLDQSEPRRRFDPATWSDVIGTNLIGNVAVVDAAADSMREEGGRICFLAGGGAAYEYPLFPAYAASKVAIVRTVENLAAAWSDVRDFAAVAVAPGAVATDMLEAVVAAGGEVRTRTDVGEVVAFVRSLLESTSTALSGRFVHVRDPWREVLDGDLSLDGDRWKLRRID